MGGHLVPNMRVHAENNLVVIHVSPVSARITTITLPAASLRLATSRATCGTAPEAVAAFCRPAREASDPGKKGRKGIVTPHAESPRTPFTRDRPPLFSVASRFSNQ